MRYIEQTVGKNGSKLAAYLHDTSGELANAAKRSAILIFPGGGYAMCSDREAEPIALAYMAEGYNAFVLRYSVGRGVPGIAAKALEDADSAMQALVDNVDTWNLVPNKIATVGFSAGGHLAASLGTMGRLKPSAMILGYPCTLKDLMDRLGINAPGLVDNVTKDTPPTFLFHTRNDAIVPVGNAIAFADALDRAGVAFEMHIFHEGPHGLSLGKPLSANGNARQVNPIAAQWFLMSIAWLRMIWGDFLVGEAYDAMRGETYQGVTKTPIGSLIKQDAIWQEVLKEIPSLQTMLSHSESVKAFTLESLAMHASDAITVDVIERLQEKFPGGGENV